MQNTSLQQPSHDMNYSLKQASQTNPIGAMLMNMNMVFKNHSIQRSEAKLDDQRKRRVA